MLLHTRSCNAENCLTCKTIKAKIEESASGWGQRSSTEPSAPIDGWGGVQDSTAERHAFSSELLRIMKTRGARLPCAEVLRSPDFLSLLIDCCGVGCLLPYASTCRAWRDAVDERPVQKVGAMIEQMQSGTPEPNISILEPHRHMAYNKAFLATRAQQPKHLAPHAAAFLAMLARHKSPADACTLLLFIPADSLVPHAATLVGLLGQHHVAPGELGKVGRYPTEVIGVLRYLRTASTGAAVLSAQAPALLAQLESAAAAIDWDDGEEDETRSDHNDVEHRFGSVKDACGAPMNALHLVRTDALGRSPCLESLLALVRHADHIACRVAGLIALRAMRVADLQALRSVVWQRASDAAEHDDVRGAALLTLARLPGAALAGMHEQMAALLPPPNLPGWEVSWPQEHLCMGLFRCLGCLEPPLLATHIDRLAALVPTTAEELDECHSQTPYDQDSQTPFQHRKPFYEWQRVEAFACALGRLDAPELAGHLPVLLRLFAFGHATAGPQRYSTLTRHAADALKKLPAEALLAQLPTLLGVEGGDRQFFARKLRVSSLGEIVGALVENGGAPSAANSAANSAAKADDDSEGEGWEVLEVVTDMELAWRAGHAARWASARQHLVAVVDACLQVAQECPPHQGWEALKFVNAHMEEVYLSELGGQEQAGADTGLPDCRVQCVQVVGKLIECFRAVATRWPAEKVVTGLFGQPFSESAGLQQAVSFGSHYECYSFDTALSALLHALARSSGVAALLEHLHSIVKLLACVAQRRTDHLRLIRSEGSMTSLGPKGVALNKAVLDMRRRAVESAGCDKSAEAFANLLFDVVEDMGVTELVEESGVRAWASKLQLPPLEKALEELLQATDAAEALEEAVCPGLLPHHVEVGRLRQAALALQLKLQDARGELFANEDAND